MYFDIFKDCLHFKISRHIQGDIEYLEPNQL